MNKIDKVPHIDLFLETQLFEEGLSLIDEALTKEEYLTEVFSSEFFEYDSVNERNEYEEEIYREYRRIRPQLVKGYRSKKLTEKYFRLEKENMLRNLEKDREHVKEIVEKTIEKLQTVNEKDFDVNVQAQRNKKIEEFKSYRRKTLRRITAERKEVENFYDSNPQLLII